MKLKTLELQKVYKEGELFLREAGIEEASIDAWLLLEFVTGISRAKYLCDPAMEIKEEDAQKYCELMEKRSNRIPLQHLTGEQEFMGYTFKVNEHVLIPRQDTEVLVEEAIKYLRPGKIVLDMCTGSGCILISLLKMGAEKFYMRNVKGTAVDISEEALKIADIEYMNTMEKSQNNKTKMVSYNRKQKKLWLVQNKLKKILAEKE